MKSEADIGSGLLMTSTDQTVLTVHYEKCLGTKKVQFSQAQWLITTAGA